MNARRFLVCPPLIIMGGVVQLPPTCMQRMHSNTLKTCFGAGNSHSFPSPTARAGPIKDQMKDDHDVRP